MLYKIRKAHRLDDTRFYNFLKNDVEDKKLLQNIKDHIRHGVAYKLQDEDENIKGVFLAKKFESHISLSYYLLDEEYRRKPVSLAFFQKCIYELKVDMPIYVVKNKNYDTYKAYFEYAGDNQLLFKGLRKELYSEAMEFIEWVE